MASPLIGAGFIQHRRMVSDCKPRSFRDAGGPVRQSPRCWRCPKADQGRVSFLVEVCDPSEASDYAYSANGILVSDFYTPNYFDPVKAPGVRYSYTGAITEPRQVLKGGYLSWEDAVSGSWWQEIWFDTAQPSFRNIGPIDPKTAGNLRAAIDRLTMENTMNAIRRGKQFAEAAGIHVSVVTEFRGVQCRIPAR